MKDILLTGHYSSTPSALSPLDCFGANAGGGFGYHVIIPFRAVCFAGGAAFRNDGFPDDSPGPSP
jgi:hypothetical protein